MPEFCSSLPHKVRSLPDDGYGLRTCEGAHGSGLRGFPGRIWVVSDGELTNEGLSRSCCVHSVGLWVGWVRSVVLCSAEDFGEGDAV